MKIVPIGSNLLIRLDERPEKTASGIYFKEAWEAPITTAEIIGVGPTSTYKPKTRVIINPYAMHPTPTQNEFIINEADLKAVEVENA